MVVSAPQTEHLGAALLKRSGEIESFACSRISAGTTVSDFGCALRFIWNLLNSQCLFSIWQMSRPDTTCPSPFYAASGICTTAATSRADAHRGHFWPDITRGYFPRRSISAGTVCVQIGQCANPFVCFSVNVFIALGPPLHPTQKSQQGLCQIRKYS